MGYPPKNDQPRYPTADDVCDPSGPQGFPLEVQWNRSGANAAKDVIDSINRLLGYHTEADIRKAAKDDAVALACAEWNRKECAKWEAAGCDNSIWGATPREMVDNLWRSLNEEIAKAKRAFQLKLFEQEAPTRQEVEGNSGEVQT
jgi:hypothetical protein